MYPLICLLYSRDGGKTWHELDRADSPSTHLRMRQHMTNLAAHGSEGEVYRLVRISLSPTQDDEVLEEIVVADSPRIGEHGVIRPYPKPREEPVSKDEIPLGLLAELARDLYQVHCDTGISLDDWDSAREFVEIFYGPVIKNGV